MYLSYIQSRFKTILLAMMKDFSLFLIKNSLGAKMKKGFKNLCNGNDSTSTLNQHCKKSEQQLFVLPEIPTMTPPRTLEEMILQLELEEEIARKAKLHDYGDHHPADEDLVINIQGGRMSCVNNSDILRSARNAALNQYPRFSLDGKDAMYRSSFHRSPVVSSSTQSVKRKAPSVLRRTNLQLPPTMGCESVIWCKPGVVAKLMGLDAVPVPIMNYNKLHNNNSSSNKERLSSVMKKQSLRRIAERREMERRRRLLHLDMNGCVADTRFRRGTTRDHVGSCSRDIERQVHVMQPVTASNAYGTIGQHHVLCKDL